MQSGTYRHSRRNAEVCQASGGPCSRRAQNQGSLPHDLDCFKNLAATIAAGLAVVDCLVKVIMRR